jgi:lipoprotein-anchoring transpeptidase ErfK/SrfK
VAPTTTTTIGPEPAPALVAPLAPLGAGDAGDAVVALQQRLIDLGFWIDEADGEYGHVTTQAVMAFQKYYVDFDLETSGRADQATVDALAAVTLKPFSRLTEGDAMVVDKPRQVLHVVREGRTLWTINTSTGTGRRYTETNQMTGEPITDVAITPEGQFGVYREYASGWESGQLGRLYRPKYFKGGVAVHGSNSIPNYPASHGCVRVSNPAMDFIWENQLMPRGSTVVVHGE